MSHIATYIFRSFIVTPATVLSLTALFSGAIISDRCALAQEDSLDNMDHRPSREAPPSTAVNAPAAHATETPKPEKKMPKSGVIASTIPGGYGRQGFPTWSDADIQGKEAPPISGSVSRVGQKDWKLVVVNNSEDHYSCSIKVAQITRSGSTAKSDSFTLSLKAGERVERPVSGSESAVGATVILESFKKTAAKKKVDTRQVPVTKEAPVQR